MNKFFAVVAIAFFSLFSSASAEDRLTPEGAMRQIEFLANYEAAFMHYKLHKDSRLEFDSKCLLTKVNLITSNDPSAYSVEGVGECSNDRKKDMVLYDLRVVAEVDTGYASIDHSERRDQFWCNSNFRLRKTHDGVRYHLMCEEGRTFIDIRLSFIER